MKACLVYRSIRSVSWAVKKASAQLKVMYDEHGVTIVTSMYIVTSMSIE